MHHVYLMTHKEYRSNLLVAKNLSARWKQRKETTRRYIKESLRDTKHLVEEMVMQNDHYLAWSRYAAELRAWFNGSRIGTPPSMPK